MLVNVEQEKIFHITFNGCQVRDLKQFGKSWNGMIELRDAIGNVLILSKPDFLSEMTEEVFGKGDGSGLEFCLIKASPYFMEALRLTEMAANKNG